MPAGTDLRNELREALNAVNERTKLEEQAANRLLSLQISNAKKLADLQISYINAKAEKEIKANQEINEKLIRQGFDANLVLHQDRLKFIQEEHAEQVEKIRERMKSCSEDEIKAAIAVVDAEYDAREKHEDEFIRNHQKEMLDIEAARTKLREKNAKKEAKKEQQLAAGIYDSLGNALFGGLNGKTQELVDKLLEEFPELSEDEAKSKAKKLQKAATINETMETLANFAKQLESTIKEVGDAMAPIDTRLQGSRNRKWTGSYWKAMSQDVVRYVGMSPIVKQADVVNNLKTLVGKGISFDVEQRAFLQTISEKIANTFDATDSTLLKLVRIQQADTTAARLGMESALTSFLNSMYETSEYMTDAAASVKQSLYEASALMGAASATAFEYQVQKWIGSLYSVGFSNAEGLAGALGKLASGDISDLTDGGYGNLLIMAANKANLSIAEILAQGLDDSETNKLMRAMVEYLGEIYESTKGSRVVAQQFANVYGLTASDLKAAANLARSTTNISNSNLTYNGMIGQLQNMAGSAASRTSMGEILTNVFDNLKFAISESMASNPVLYATYTIANMLTDTVGGIDIPLPLVMGSGLNYKLNVADLMRVASMSGGILGGIGKMLMGLGNQGTGAGMLRGFGIGSGLTTLSRGAPASNLITRGSSVSSSGYVGNSDSGDIQNKLLTDAKNDANSTVAEASDDSSETKLKTVDEHIIQIYDLLTKVTDGDRLRVQMEGNDVFPNSIWSR